MRAEIIRCDSKDCPNEVLAAVVDSGSDHGWVIVNDGSTIQHYCGGKHYQDAAKAYKGKP